MSANTPKKNSQLVSCSIYPPGSWDNVVKVNVCSTLGKPLSQIPALLYALYITYILFYLVFTVYFFLQYVVVKQTPVIVFHTTQSAF